MLTANDLVKQTRPKQLGAEDGANDIPRTNAAPYASTTEQDIQSLCQEEVTTQYGAFVKAITETRNQISSIRKSLPTDIKGKASALVNAFKGALQDHRLAIDQAADEVERRAKDLRLFKVLNDLTYEAD